MRDSGGQCVMISGGPMMLKWHADSLDSLLMVIYIIAFRPSCHRTLFFSGAIAYSNARFGRGTGLILLDNVGCTGGESRLLDCSNYGGVGVYSSNCGHDDDAGVRCNGKSFRYMTLKPYNYTIEKLNYNKFLLKSLATTCEL